MNLGVLSNVRNCDYMARTSERSARTAEQSGFFAKVMEETKKTCPYSHMAKDGVIDYKGVQFVCDYRTNSICLGDVSDPKKVLNISLPSGGNLKVNLENLKDLNKAAGMFSPADLNAIMKAISEYNHCTKKLNELEEDKIEAVGNVAEKSDVE
jgi:hypothetical protein